MQEALQTEQTTHFKLENDPAWRVALISLDEDDHVLSVVMHHIISDGWSINVIRTELEAFYSAALRGQGPLAAVNTLPVQYRDFAVWQRQHSQS
jgi:NRPS condensation-like uncharacterized protein